VVVNEAMRILMNATKEYYKLQMIDNLPKDQIPPNECTRIIKELIEDPQIKELLAK
jgi:hypothetical protein